MVILTVIIFVALLLALVLVHEWGHFIAAKKAGCDVNEFGFGFPPRLFSKKWRGTLFSFNLLPLGGFVKIEGEDMQDANPGPRSFAGKSATWRIIILSAGVAMNIVLAAVFFSVQAGIGIPVVADEASAGELRDLHTYIVNVDEASPAGEAGLQAFDRIARINDVADPTVDQVQQLVAAANGSAVTVEAERAGQHLTFEVTPRVSPPPGEGALGISLAATGLKKVPLWQAPFEGIKRTGQMLVAIVGEFGRLLSRLVTSGSVSEGLAGPVGIAVLANEATKLGAPYVLEFGALISLNLAIINILPFPALDGGRILFVVLEKIAGRKFPARIEQITHTIGFALLIFLMIAITFKDVRRFF